MNLRNLVRLTVAKTNPYWPFSTLNRVPYSFAIKSFLRTVGKFPEIKSVYLRHGLLRDWIPAISDIDLTLIIESGLKTEQEFAFLNSFWSEFKRLKKVFPMLGEIDILHQKQCDAWVNVSIRGFESKDWILLSGDRTLPESTLPDSEKLLFDSMDYALICYLNLFLRRLFQDGPKSPLFEYEIKRIASKIIHYIHYEESFEGRNGSFRHFDLLSKILKSFEERLSFIPDKPEECAESDSMASSVPEMEQLGKVVSSVVLSHNRDVLVLKRVMDFEPGFDWMMVSGKILQGRKGPPAIVSKKMFNYMLRYFDPYLYSHLQEFGKVAYGSNPLNEVSSPEISSFIRCILMQNPNLLAFPQTAALIAPSSYPPYSDRVLDSMLEHALFIKLYLEKGFISRRHSELLSESREHFNEYYQRLLQLRQKSSSDLELFRFWKELAEEIYCLKPHVALQEWKH